MSILFETFHQTAVTQLWQLTVVICVAGLAAQFACRRRPHWAYVLWLVVLVKAVTPPIWTSPTGVFSWTGSLVAQTAGPSQTATKPLPPGAADGLPAPEADGLSHFQDARSP
ncbi:MAG: hypothetical protein JW719_06995 [Pirellulales bacterium]|nr:hypothetical protein [Pirellulales bacterium]